MALIQCPECGQNVSDTCTQCIHCGFVLTKEQSVLNTVSEDDYTDSGYTMRDIRKWLITSLCLFSILIIGILIAVLGLALENVIDDSDAWAMEIVGSIILVIGIPAAIAGIVFLIIYFHKRQYVNE